MNLVVQVGPDTLGITKYRTINGLKRAILSASKKGAKRKDSVDCEFLGRRYSSLELQEAEVMTLKNYFQVIHHTKLGRG